MKLVVAVLLAVSLLMIEPAAAKKDKKADKIPPGTVAQITDERIKESSGLALSAKHDDLVYTINDRGTTPLIYAVTLSSGEVVGTADISGLKVEDTESIAVDAKGTMWLGDLGDNDHVRQNVAIFSFPEPGPGDKTVSKAKRFPVKFPGGPVDVEGMLVHPTTSRIHLVSKIRDGSGTVFELPELKPGTAVTATDLQVQAPVAVTDATYPHGGDKALLRTNDDLWVYDPTTWKPLVQQDTPKLKQGESVVAERSDRTVLIGSEGKNSPIVRFAIPTQTAVPGVEGNAAPAAAASKQPSADASVVMVAVLGVLLVALVIVYRRRIKEQAPYPGW
jgi:hypothetical protein